VSNFCNENEACCDYTYYPSAPMQFDAGNYPEDHVKASASCVRDGETKVFDTIPCGAFTVGDRIPCVEDIMIATSSEYCSGYGNCEVSLDKISNLRDAVLNFDLTLNGGADTISVYFIDVNGIQSQAGGYLMTSGSYSLPVLDFIDVDMFDPERITKVIFKSANELSFEVKNIFTTCPNSLKLGSCVITYNGSKLIFTGNSSNAQNCIISGSYDFSETISCKGSWTFTKEIDLSSYAGETLTWDITAKNFQDPSITETCSGSVDIKAPSGSCSWSPTTLTATTTGTAQFTANFVDCPTSGCAYEIKNHQGIPVATGTGTVGTATMTDTVSVGTYTYTAYVKGVEVCNADLTVKAGAAPTASCGGVTSDGKFTASVTDTDKVGWTWKVVVTDYLGNVLHTSPVSGAQTGNGSIAFTGYNPSVAGSYTYSLFLNGSLTSECYSSLTVAGSITNCSLTPTTINSGEYVTFSATTEKVADETPCTIKHSDGTEYTSGSLTVNSNQCSSTFYPTQAGEYSVYIGDYNKKCGTVTINGGTSCEYQSSWCNGMPIDQVQGNISNYTNNNESTQNCIFIVGVTDSTIFNGLNKTGILVNGVQADLHYNNSWLASNVTKADGGYYFYYPKNTDWSQISNAATGIPNCEAPVIPSSSSVVPSSSSVVASSSSGGTTITLTYDGASYDFAPGTYFKFGQTDLA
jgi:hypothetical protein